MVFVSLEGFLESGADLHAKPPTRVPTPHAQQPPQAPVHVVVTPGSPAKPSASSASSSGQKRSRLRRATSAFSSFATTKNASPTDVGAVASSPALVADQFVVYVTDHDVHHKWVIARSPAEYLQLKRSLQTILTGCACRQFACCGPLRRIVSSSQYKKPKRRWSESRVVTQFVHCAVIQEFLNDLLLAVLGRDAECDATRQAWEAVSEFLDVEIQRSEVADKIVLATVEDQNHSQSLRRSVSEEIPAHRPSIVIEQDPVVEIDHKSCRTFNDEGAEFEANSSDDEEAECPICCSNLEGEQTNTKTARLLCGHKYHAECVRMWLRMHHTCPVCRIPIEGL